MADTLQQPPEGGPPIGSPPTREFDGPWFTTQLYISSAMGIISFLLFSYARKKWPLLFASRTKLKGFSPHEAHAHQAFFGWIIPTLKTSEITILQIVGLDAAVLLNFYKMSFQLFTVMSIFAMLVLMPINYKNNLGTGTEDGDDDWLKAPPNTQPQGRDWLELLNDANSYLSLHLAFTYLFTGVALRFIYKNYTRFIRARQLYSLELVHSIAARTVMVTDLPNHLRGDRVLAVYFESMGLTVESVSVCREVGTLSNLLDRRTKALLELENAWTKYLGNPSTVEAFDPSNNAAPPLIDIEGDQSTSVDTPAGRVVVPHRKRPTMRPGWFQSEVDALEYLETRFKESDDAVQQKRKAGKFKASQAAFVTFEKMSSAQIASQVAHAPQPQQCVTCLAPEPRDIVWANMTYSRTSMRVREIIVFIAMAMIFFFWVFPVAALATLLSYKEISKIMPWLARLIDSNAQVQAIVQNLLPSVAIITLNALTPFLFEALSYLQGYRARSWIEYSLLKKYFLFLLVNVVFIFLLASTYWQLIRDLAESPAKVPEKLAQALQQGRARHFFLSYVILQGLGIMPLQLLNLGVIIPRIIYRMFLTRTPRDFAELNAPPMINYGVVYPQSILIFVVTILYSVIQPAILVFGALYFGCAYLVYKYKLLFVFYKPYESQGEAWPITFTRLIWGVMIFQVFMTGIFLLKQGLGFVLASLMVPLLVGTFAWSIYIARKFKPLSENVNLSSVFEVQRGEDTEDVVRMREGHPVSWSQSHLSRRRYGQNDETLYVAPEDERTDYSQPPMANWYSGVLNTGKRRYGHPALSGVLPQPWLPLKKGQTLVNRGNGAGANGKPKESDEAVVLTLRKRYSTVRRKRGKDVASSFPPDSASTPGVVNGEDVYLPTGGAPAISTQSSHEDLRRNPWLSDTSLARAGQTSSRRPSAQPLHHRLSFDDATGVITLPENADWLMEEVDTDSEEDYGSTTSPSVSGVADGAEDASQTPGLPQDEEALANTSTSSVLLTSTPMSSPSKQRHGTYYHHPEKRRQTIPGAFPRSFK